ncbi:RidA family protein [soil metagenome]
MATTQKVAASLPLDQGLGISKAVRTGNHVFVSGQMSLDEDGNVLHPGQLAAQFRQAFDNLVAAVEQAGGTAQDVVATHMFLTQYPDQDDFVAICEAHKRTFSGQNQPTGTMVYVPRLPVDGAMVEVTGVAIVG